MALIALRVRARLTNINDILKHQTKPKLKMTHGWKCKTRQLTSWKPLTANFFLLHLLLKKGQIQACIRTSGPVSLNENRLLYPFGFWSFDQRGFICLTFQATVHCAFSAYPITPDSLGGKYNVVHIGRVASPKRLWNPPTHLNLRWNAGDRNTNDHCKQIELRIAYASKVNVADQFVWSV